MLNEERFKLRNKLEELSDDELNAREKELLSDVHIIQDIIARRTLGGRAYAGSDYQSEVEKSDEEGGEQWRNSI